MSTDSPPPTQLKEWFNVQRYQSLARQLKSLAPDFNSRRFLEMTLSGLESRSLMQRLSQAAIGMQACVPGNFRRQVGIFKEMVPLVDHEFVCIVFSDFVAKFGRADRTFSLEALKYFTRYGSAEFAIRYFLVDDLHGTLAVMQKWTTDADEKVRRLASEGSRPRLPWGQRLQELVRDPNPLAAILEPLKADPALFVRKSVANHLNDIAKDHPDWVIERLQSWDRSVSETAWIAKHAARTLIKQGSPKALALFGFGKKAEVKSLLQVTPGIVPLGGQITLAAEISSLAKYAQSLVIDYVIHYVKAHGGTSAKVFKWSEVTLPAGGRLRLEKRQTLRDFTTRKHFPGRHRVELQVNGCRVAEAGFDLLI